MLRSIELAGFKSFAKKSALEFKSPITAIVGPNGSGKSNVAEAFRFVLGEQSIKSLRGKKGEDLIFNGSNEVAKSNRASVKITFDNLQRKFNIDFDEVTIERVVHRDSANQYYINGSQTRLKDIFELLAPAHIGASGHHIISQGEADQILNANIRERKEMLEDALGLKLYQYKRQESERKLEKTEENIKSVESLRREIAPHLKFLQKQVEKVEKAFELKKTLADLYKDYLKREDNYLKENKARLEAEIAEPTKGLKELEHKLEKAKKILAAQAHTKKSGEIIELEQKIAELRKERDGVTREIGRLEGEISSQERLLKKHTDTHGLHTDTMIGLAEVQVLREEISSYADEAEVETEVGALRQTIQRIQKLIESFISDRKSRSQGNIASDIKDELSRLAKEKNGADKRMADIEQQREKLESQYQVVKAEVEHEKDSSRDAEKEVIQIMSDQNKLHAKLDLIKNSEHTLTLVEEDFKRELAEAGMLLGRAATEFYDHVVDSAEEPRKAQEDRRRAIEKIKIRLEEAGIGSSEEIMKEFKSVSERDTFLTKELGDLEVSAKSLKELIVELGQKLDEKFKEGVHKVNKQFQEFFELMFGGGNASLSVVKEAKRKRKELLTSDEGDVEEMEEPDDDGETEEGIEINVSLPRKKIRGLVMLSGGERALTSIALLFAISQVNPPPFIILDETDAALDEANSKKYGDMIENLAKYSQLILITHNRETMSRAGVLYGVTMGSGGVSKLLSIQFEEAVVVAK
ncbi:AAA family ATPase [Candidatus Parcubacteria bacterium]|nr:AAA family ATPase [Candidatus Parcubacteria bacterium]